LEAKTGPDSGKFCPETEIFSNLPKVDTDNNLFPGAPSGRRRTMAVAVTRDGESIRVEWLTRWYGRLPSLPFAAGGLFFFYNAGLIVRDDLAGLGRWSEDWAGLLFCVVCGLLIGAPGLVLATFRYFVDLDKAPRRVIVTRQFGPLKIRSQRQLAEFQFISITDDCDTTLTTYNVNLCGGKGVDPVLFSEFTKREEADDFARELGRALKLPFRDLVGTPVDDPDL
jgi:hypothetical protein